MTRRIVFDSHSTNIEEHIESDTNLTSTPETKIQSSSASQASSSIYQSLIFPPDPHESDRYESRQPRDRSQTYSGRTRGRSQLGDRGLKDVRRL